MRILDRINRRFLLRYRLEYGAALLLVYLVRSLSPAFAWSAARAIGALLFRLGLRRRAIRANLAVAFPDLPEAERDRIGRAAMQHFLCVAVDILLERRMLSRGNLLDRVRITGWAREYLDRYGKEGFRERARRVLFLTAHLGNWELASGVFGLLGIHVVPVFRALRNPFVDGLIRRIRLDAHGRVLERRGAVQAMIEEFDRGGNVGLLFDQEASQGLDVPFFGLPARTHKTPAVLARDHDVRIFFGVMIREGDFLRYEGRGELIDLPPRSEDRQADLERITADLMRRLEEEIRRRPEQYFWMHRRWKRAGVHDREVIPW